MPSPRLRVSQVVPSLAERHGGPSKSVRALANAMATAGDQVRLFATTVPTDKPMADGADAAVLHLSPRVVPRFIARSPALRLELKTTPTEIVHHHSLWLRTLHYAHETARLQRVPLVISPRGMMSEWAYRHHGWRKQVAARLIHPGAIAAATGWHATSPEEAADIRRLGIAAPICVAPNGVVVPTTAELSAMRQAWQRDYPESRTRPIALFYSRLHRKKRLLELIDLWLSLPTGDWLLLIVGTRDEYDAIELALSLRDRTDGRVHFYDGANRPPPYAIASLFLLPSHSENFGLAIAEALAAGVPVLVTDTTPWRRVEPTQAGWCVPWEIYGRTLSRALDSPAEELAAMGANGREWMAREFSWNRAATLLRNFYAELVPS